MLQWFKELLFGKEMTPEEIQMAIQCKEAMMGQQIFNLDRVAAEKLVKEFGCPTRVADGTRLDN